MLITSLPFVRTARSSYRLSDPVNKSDRRSAQVLSAAVGSFVNLSLRGRRSRNKVSVGEPAEGSLTRIQINTFEFTVDPSMMFIHLGVYPGVSIGVGFRVALGRHHF